MPDLLPLQLYRTDLIRIVVSVFQTMLNMEAEPVPNVWESGRDIITGAVYIAGAWRGAVLIECKPAQALDFARRFTGVEAPLGMEDMRDMLGELTNMLAGNLKSVWPHGVCLSMPSVVQGTDYLLRVCGEWAAEQIHFLSPAGSFCVTLLQMAAPN